MNKVLIPTKLDAAAGKALTDNGNYVVIQEAGVDLVSFCKSHSDAHALIVRSEKISAEIIDLLPELKVVVRAGAGFNTIDIKYARQRGIDVMNTPGANSNAVAEEVVALMLADARHVIAGDASVRAAKWEKSKFMGKEVTGKTVGVVGFGAIGQLVAKRLSGFDVKILAYDPFLSESKAKELGVDLVDLAEVFEKSDYVSLHIPENDETRGLINKDLLGKMKDGSSVINCARAGIINEEDLAAVKAEKGLRYLNDVYPKDEAGEKPIAKIADITLPHLGASTKEANYNAAMRSAEQLIDLDEKGIISYVVNRDVPAGLDENYADLAFTLSRLTRELIGSGKQLKQIETSYYGELKNFADWLIVPVVSALSEDFDRTMSPKVANEYLAEKGVSSTNRESDDKKGYGNSITIDLIANNDKNNLTRVSVRGTITEGRLMISRIDDFEKLYIEPQGHNAIFVYEDRPGILGQIGVALAQKGYNIDDVRNPHDSKGKESIALLKLNKAVSQEDLAEIATSIEATKSACVSF